MRTMLSAFLLSVFLCPTASLAQEVVSGIVTFSEDGAPAAGVRVTFFDLGGLHRAFSAITDSDGRFEMPLGSQDRSGQGTFRLLQNYPNPFNPSTVIPYELSESASVRLEIFSVLGQRVRGLVDGVQPAGHHTATWDALDDQGRGVAAGVYLYSLTVGGMTDTRRMVLLDGRQTSAGGGFPRSAGVVSNAGQQVGGTYGVTIYGPGVVTSVQQAVVVDPGTGSLSFAVSRVGSQTAPKVTQQQADVLGDVNNDGRVNISDALIVATYGLDSSISIPNNGDISLGDVNGDGRVNISDALIIASYGIDPSNPALPAGIGQTVVSGQERVQIQVALPTGTSLKVEKLTIITPVISLAPDVSGDATVTTTTLDKPQVVLVENARGNLVLLGYVMPSGVGANPAAGKLAKLAADGTVEVSPTTTALALAMMNPLLAGSSADQREQVASSVMDNADFPGLVAQIESRLRSDPEGVLNGDGSEVLYETAARILVDVLTEGLPARKDVATGNTEDPWIVDASGNNLIFVNPNYVYYGVGVSDRGSDAYRETVVLEARGAFFELLRWPPVKFDDEHRSDPLFIPNGTYTMLMTKGCAYPFSRITDLGDPVGQATLLNFAQMIFNTLDVVLSLPKVGIGDLVTNLSKLELDLNGADITTIGTAISEGDVRKVVTVIITLTVSNVDNIGTWLFESSAKPKNFAKYIGKLLPLLKNVAVPLKVLGAVNKVPFFYDLVAAPREVTYEVTHVDGELNVFALQTYRISGAVTESGSRLSGVTVTLSGDADTTTTTGSDESYTFSDLLDGSYTVTPSKAGYTFSPASPAVTVAGRDVAQDFVATPTQNQLPTATISGKVTEGGTELSGVTVTLGRDSSDTKTTGLDGSYAFSDLPDGDYTVTPSKSGYTFSPASPAVTVAGRDVAQDFVATPTQNQLLTATITSPVDGSEFTVGDTITFRGTGSDPEDGTLIGSSLVWSSSRDGRIGTGTSVSTSGLSEGSHTITLNITLSIDG